MYTKWIEISLTDDIVVRVNVACVPDTTIRELQESALARLNYVLRKKIELTAEEILDREG